MAGLNPGDNVKDLGSNAFKIVAVASFEKEGFVA